MGSDEKMMNDSPEKILLSMKTTPSQSRMLMEWNIPASSADTENPTGQAWTGKALADMLPDSLPDRYGRPCEFAVDHIWYRGLTPVFNGPDPVRNMIEMIVWIVRNGLGEHLLIDPQPETPWTEFLEKKNAEISDANRREAALSKRKTNSYADGWKNN